MNNCALVSQNRVCCGYDFQIFLKHFSFSLARISENVIHEEKMYISKTIVQTILAREEH